MREAIEGNKADLQSIKRYQKALAERQNTGPYGEETKVNRDELINFRSNSSQNRLKTID